MNTKTKQEKGKFLQPEAVSKNFSPFFKQAQK